jgi:hypothetical protein
MCLVVVLLAGMTQSSLAQSNSLSPHEVVPNLFQQTRVDDIAEDPARVIVRASRLHPDGQIASGLLITCYRSRSGHETLAIQDHTLPLTDDRLAVGSGFCDAMLAVARQHQAIQQR